MKNKILTFVIGMLVGAIITTLGFYIYDKVKSSNNSLEGMPDFEGNMPGMNSEMSEPPELPDSNSSDSSSSSDSTESKGQPPAKPDGESGNDQGGQPPAKPDSNGNRT